MGGSGGFGGYSSISALSKLLNSENESKSSQKAIAANAFLEELLKDYNGRDTEAINKHLSAIEKTLEREIEGLDRILFGGSIAKNTFIEGTSDVDALVVMDYEKYKNSSPKELQRDFLSLLRTRFPNTEIKSGTLAVTLKFHDYEIQLLPAIRKNGKIQIADNNGTKWSSAINTSAFTEKLTKVNQNNSNKVVPAIKVIKGLLSNLPEKYQLSGYHIEALAVDAFSAYSGRRTLYDMTSHFLKYAESRVKQPMRDITGQSGIIDDYLGQAGSLTRQHLSNYLKSISSKFSSSVEDMQALFD